MLKSTKARHTLVMGATALCLSLMPGSANAVSAQIVGFTHAGNGCPAGTVGYVFDAVNNKLTLSFDEFAATLPPGDSASCTLSFVVKVPSPYQISLNKVEYLGYVDTEPTVYGQLRRRYKYGDNPPLSKVKNFAYGQQGDFYIVDQFPGWSQCTNQVTMTTTARVDLQGTSSGGVNEIVVDVLQYDTQVVFYFGLLPC